MELDTLRLQLPAANTVPLTLGGLGEAPTVVMPVEASPPMATPPVTSLTEGASQPAVLPSGLPKRNRLELGDEPVSMSTLGELGRKGQSNYDPDPDRTALVKYVASLGIADLEALASGDRSGVPSRLLESVSSATINDAMGYAGKLAITLREQHVRPSSQEPSRRPSTSRLNRLMRGAQAGREAVFNAEFDSIPDAPAGSLPVRVPGKVRKEELSELRDRLRRRGGAFRIAGDHRYVKTPADHTYVGYPAEAVNNTYRSNNNHDGDTQIIPKNHRVEDKTVRLPVSGINVAVNGSVTRTEQRAKELSRPSLRAIFAAGFAAVAGLVSRDPSQHRAPDSYQGRRRALAFNN